MPLRGNLRGSSLPQLVATAAHEAGLQAARDGRTGLIASTALLAELEPALGPLHPRRSTFDEVSASVEAVPQAWLEQLAPGGILVYPEAAGDEDRLVRLTSTAAGLEREVIGRCRFVRMQL